MDPEDIRIRVELEVVLDEEHFITVACTIKDETTIATYLKPVKD